MKRKRILPLLGLGLLLVTVTAAAAFTNPELLKGTFPKASQFDFNASFVTYSGGEIVASTLTSGESTVAILKLTNEEISKAGFLKELTLSIDFNVGGLNEVRVERIGSSSESLATSLPASSGTVTFDIAKDFSSSDQKLKAGEAIYLAVIADVTLDAAVDDEYLQVKVNNANGPWISWVNFSGAAMDGVYKGVKSSFAAKKITEAL